MEKHNLSSDLLNMMLQTMNRHPKMSLCRPILPLFVGLGVAILVQPVSVVSDDKVATSNTRARQNLPGGSDLSLSLKPSSEPIFVTSESLTLKSDSRKFQYLKNVKVVQGDLTLVCDRLDGEYLESNQLKELEAIGNVVITKGANIKAASDRAAYDAQQEVFTLTEHPQITQDGSILEADVVRVFVRENRTVAQGQVRVKMIKAENAKDKGSPAPPAKVSTKQ